MSVGTGAQKAAKKIRKETGVAYTTCLQIIKSKREEIRQAKADDPSKPYSLCVLEVARKYIKAKT